MEVWSSRKFQQIPAPQNAPLNHITVCSTLRSAHWSVRAWLVLTLGKDLDQMVFWHLAAHDHPVPPNSHMSVLEGNDCFLDETLLCGTLTLLWPLQRNGFKLGHTAWLWKQANQETQLLRSNRGKWVNIADFYFAGCLWFAYNRFVHLFQYLIASGTHSPSKLPSYNWAECD